MVSAFHQSLLPIRPFYQVLLSPLSPFSFPSDFFSLSFTGIAKESPVHFAEFQYIIVYSIQSVIILSTFALDSSTSGLDSGTGSPLLHGLYR